MVMWMWVWWQIILLCVLARSVPCPLGSLFVWWLCIYICLFSFVYSSLRGVSQVPRENQALYGLVFVFVFVFAFLFVFVFVYVSLCGENLIGVSQLPRESQASYGLVAQPDHLSQDTGHIKHHWTQDTKKDTTLILFKLDVNPNTSQVEAVWSQYIWSLARIL